MEEHIFGTFSTDHLKVTHERAAALGLQHRVRTIPPDPLPDEAFTVVVTSGLNFSPHDVVLFYTTDGEIPTLDSEAIAFARVGRTWNTVAWGYVTEWHASIPPLAEGTLMRYRIAGREVGGAWQWADWPSAKRVVEQTFVHGEAVALQMRSDERGEFARSIDRYAPPQWAQDAILYQIFLDRFSRDEDTPWQEKPLDVFHGGTLAGVTRRLEHIAALGATCVWLTPLFPSPSYHGYDASDYYEVEPRYGTKAELKTLVDRAHALGLKVILDFTCNHISNEHPLFQQALANPNSEARQWFWIGAEEGLHGYRSFFDVATMPELNTDHPAVRDYLIGAAQMWLNDFGVDGFRLDYAHGPSHAFWAHFWQAVKTTNPDAWCFGEVVDTPDSQRGYVGYLDGVLDFHLGDGLRHVFAYRSRDLVWLTQLVQDQDAFFPPHDHFSRPAFVDNHDMDRFLYRAGDEAALRLVFLFLYTLANPPIVYYGTETAQIQRFGKVDGYGPEGAREPMEWAFSDAQQELLAFFQRLAQLRHREPAMRPTIRETLLVTPEQYIGRHQRDNETLILVLNRDKQPTTLHHPALRGDFLDLLTETRLTLDGTLALEAVAGRILKPLLN